jgi:hypothetical protein
MRVKVKRRLQCVPFSQLCLDMSQSREGFQREWVFSVLPHRKGKGDLGKAGYKRNEGLGQIFQLTLKTGNILVGSSFFGQVIDLKFIFIFIAV